MAGIPIKCVRVIYKKSAYQINVVERGDPRLKELVEANDPSIEWMLRSHEENQRALSFVKEVLKRRKIKVRWSYRAKKEREKGMDLVIAVGGDGTLLEAARTIYPGTPLMGLHSTTRGSVGYLCAAQIDEIDHVLDQLIEGIISPTEVTRIQTYINGTPTPQLALNDVLFSHPTPAATSRYEISWRGRREKQRSSGVWIASAVGSSAAIRSAGGLLMPIHSPNLQFVVREPYQDPYGVPLGITKGVPDVENPLQITSQMRKALLFFDGYHCKTPIKFGDEIVFRRASEPLLLVTPDSKLK